MFSERGWFTKNQSLFFRSNLRRDRRSEIIPKTQGVAQNDRISNSSFPQGFLNPPEYPVVVGTARGSRS
jgi:hypothetical protein